MGNLCAITDFNNLDCTDRHNCLGEHCIKLFKDRITKTGRNTTDTAFNNTAGTVLIFHAFFKISAGFSCGCCVRHIKCIIGDFFRMKFTDRNRTDGFCIGAERNSHCFQNFRGNCTGCHTADRLTTGRTPATAIITKSIFCIKCIIGMSRTIGVCYISVVSGTLIGITNHQ